MTMNPSFFQRRYPKAEHSLPFSLLSSLHRLPFPPFTPFPFRASDFLILRRSSLRSSLQPIVV